MISTAVARRRVWVFDLDNTLHNALPQVFPHISRAMPRFLQSALDLDEVAANRLRVHYWQRYGATLLGIMRHHPHINPRLFLQETHLLAELGPLLEYELGVPGLLRALPGRKILLSNAPIHYARAILRRLGVAHLFADVLCMEAMRFQPKPAPQAFRQVFKRHNLRPSRAIMVDDDLANLRTAKRLGMRTVWITQASKSPPFIDVRVKSVLQLRRSWYQL